MRRICAGTAKVQNSARVEEEMEVIMGVIAHEIGHIMIGTGHPSEDKNSDRGPAPLPGTIHINRLMRTYIKPVGVPDILVKGEWDEMEI